MTNIALLGFGVVGGGTAEVLTKNASQIARRAGDEINIKYILDLREFPGHPLGDRVVHDFSVIVSDPEITVVAEMMGGAHPAYDFTKACLEAGKSVVTSNKEVVATFGAELLKIAAEHGVRYLFEASVGGGIPIIRPMSLCLAANEIFEVDGILNGTTNYILTKMFRENASFADALSEAQAKGYAERDPRADVEGIDACRKICILSALAFGKLYSPDDVPTEGITHISSEDVRAAEVWGGVIKLIARTGLSDPENPDSGVYAKVSPCVVPNESPISGVDDVFNAIMVRGNAVGDVMFYGRGAGNLPTASAVTADIIDIVMHKNISAVPMVWTPSKKDELFDASLLPTVFLIRIAADDPEKAASLAEKAGFTRIPADGMLAFATPVTTEKDLPELVSGIGTLLSAIPVLA